MLRTRSPASPDPSMTAGEGDHVALYATEDQIARLVLGEGKDIGPPAISSGSDDDLGDVVP
jgi:hypothetical protein